MKTKHPLGLLFLLALMALPVVARAPGEFSPPSRTFLFTYQVTLILMWRWTESHSMESRKGFRIERRRGRAGELGEAANVRHYARLDKRWIRVWESSEAALGTMQAMPLQNRFVLPFSRREVKSA